MSSRILDIAVLGTGSIGTRHARLLARDQEVRLHLCDSNGNRALALGRELGTEECTVSLADLFERHLDGVLLATPEHLHIEQILEADAKQVCVLVEKPICASLDQLPALSSISPRTRHTLLAGYPLRHMLLWQAIAKHLKSGAIGTPYSFHISLGSWETISLAASRFSDLSDFGRLLFDYSHEWDYVSWFFGEVRRGVATGSVREARPVTPSPNTIDGLLECSTGLTGSFHLDYIADPGHRRLTVLGADGLLTADAGTQRLTMQRGRSPVETIDYNEAGDAMYQRQLDHWLAVIRDAVAPKVGLTEAIRAAAVAETLRQSLTSGRWEDCPLLDQEHLLPSAGSTCTNSPHAVAETRTRDSQDS